MLTPPTNHSIIDTLLNSKQIAEFQSQLLLEKLAQEINQLILNDFEKLIQCLYRMDVSEIKLKELLQKSSDTDAGTLIAKMMIERQLQKIKYSNSYTPNRADDSGEERWD